MRTYIFLIIVFSSVFSFSQINDAYSFLNLHSLQRGNKIILGTNFDVYLASNSIKNSLSNALLYDKFIDDELKASTKLKDKNYYGQRLQSNIYFSQKYDTLWGIDNMGIKVGLNYQSFKNIQFSKDFYNVLMHGNKQYEGKTADLSNLDVNTLTYQSFEFGIFKYFKEPKNGYHTVYFGFNFIKGQEYNYLYFNDAYLYTAPDGEYIDFNIKSSYFGSDSLNSNILTTNGLGGSLNFYWAYEDEKHKSRYEISLSELGLISWYKTPLNYMADTNIRLEGVEIGDLFDNDNLSDYSKDSLVNIIYADSNNATFNKALPKQFNFAYTKYLLDNKYIAKLGAGYIFNANQMMPVIFSDNQFFLSPDFNIGVSFAYGGYTGFRVGLNSSVLISNKLLIKVATTNIAGFVLDENTYSQALFLSIAYLIK